MAAGGEVAGTAEPVMVAVLQALTVISAICPLLDARPLDYLYCRSRAHRTVR